MSTVKEPWELGVMRSSGRRLAEVVAALKEAVVPGVTTAELDALAEARIRALGGVPSFKGYRVGRNVFPASICASVNNEVVHGIPGGRELHAGDVVSIDVGLIYGGYHSDCAFTVVLDGSSSEVARLLDVTRKSLYEGIAQALPGNRIGDIGHAVQSFVEPHRFGIIREYVGHGIGRLLHETPSVPNYGKPRRGLLIKAGMCLAVEPMITMGSYKTKVLADGWTVVTADGSLAAHFEHTIAVTPKGPEILTVLEGQDALN
ncbi:MAG: type I methionyl aminopeptidase [Deltaproteobacteria bacterium]|nr:type I methionyl aminopeptidase [Deltaproteobacteria bacterium]MBW2253194.1 type I methionyl aminopeptidase [Deltaproteobacteria bacterium]